MKIVETIKQHRENKKIRHLKQLLMSEYCLPYTAPLTATEKLYANSQPYAKIMCYCINYYKGKQNDIVNTILDIIKNYYSVEFIEDEINFDRLLTHLKFFAKRLIDKKEELKPSNNTLLEVVKVQYQESYNCVKQIKLFIEDNYTYKINDDEILYLILHINRVISVLSFNN